MIPLITLCSAIALTAGLVILWPLFERSQDQRRAGALIRELGRLLFERQRYLNNLKDLELDRSMEKITESDYQDLRNQMLAEAAAVYLALEKLEQSEIMRAIRIDLEQVRKELAA